MPRKELRPIDVTAIVDNREQRPHDLSPMPMIAGTLPTGDYSVRGLEPYVSIERKSLADLVSCCSVKDNRERFERELDRLRAYPVRAVVVEASWNDLQAGLWRSHATPASVTASVLAWMARYTIPFMLAGDRQSAGQVVGDLLFYAARDRWRELLTFQPELRIVSNG